MAVAPASETTESQAEQQEAAASSARSPLAAIALPTKERGLLVGKTGSGKSVLAYHLIQKFLDNYGDNARVLVIDSKPHFQAEYQLNGLSAKRLYRKYDPERPIPGSVVLPLQDIPGEMRAHWRMEPYRNRVAIAQGDLSALPWLKAAIHYFYALSSRKREQLLYVDELADFYSASGTTTLADPALKVIRSGRERHVAFLAATQRPKGIPKSALTELTQLYYFGTAFQGDTDHLREMDYPEEIDKRQLRAVPHSFYFYSHAAPERAGYYVLDKKLASEGA